VLVPVTFASSSTTTCHSIIVRPSDGVKKHLRAQNEHRQRVLTIEISMEVDRVEPAPSPPRA
jgi:hypothetical protein